MTKTIVRHSSAACLVCAVVLGCGHESTRSHTAAQVARAPSLFRFRVDFWANLHEVLFHESLVPRPRFKGAKSLGHQSVAVVTELAPADAATWHDAVAYYDAHFTNDSMFADEFLATTRALTALGAAPSVSQTASIAAEWRTRLELAAPVYRSHFWPAHERFDRAYVEAMRPLVDAHGAWLAKRLVAIYQTPWPTEPIDVEVAPVVPPFGASTVGEPPFRESHTPLITVSSEDPGYSGDTGLEMLFHEASHLLVDRIQAALDTSAKRQGRSLPPRLWHFLLFYTAGRVTKERLGPTYVPYAERPENNVFAGDSAAYVGSFERAWQPYIDGRTTLDSAIDAVVAEFEKGVAR